MGDSEVTASGETVEDEVLAAVRAYDIAVRDRDVDAQVGFFADGADISKAALRNRLETQLARGEYEDKRFALDAATVVVEGGRATVDDARLRSPTGGGSFAFTMAKEADGAWRCLSVRLSKGADGQAENARQLRERILADPARPGYHFANPEGVAMPFDPNGAIYWKGRYHLFYIFQDSRSGQRADHWGHVSSTDLFHWRHHPTGLLDGMYSGNCFINRDGIPTICYHQKGEGNAMAVALDDDLNAWQKLDTITPATRRASRTREGDEHHERYRSWDPFGWLEGDNYYAIFGGKRPGIAKSSSLDGEWRYVGDLFAHGVDGVSLTEDVSCPDLFRLGEKHVLLCISHRLGCRYYVGTWKDEQFHPESHAMMSWVDHAFFAPESLLDHRGRRIMWAWIMDEPRFGVRAAHGWSGVLSLPRVLSLGDDGRLRMDVPEEVKALRHGAHRQGPVTIEADSDLAVEGVAGTSLELLVDMEGQGASSYGLIVCASPDGSEQTSIFYDATEKRLKVDTRRSGPGDTPRAVEAAPFELDPGERLKLRVFVDRSVVEVFANGRQAIARRIYPSHDSLGVHVFARGGPAHMHALEAWRIAPSNAC